MSDSDDDDDNLLKLLTTKKRRQFTVQEKMLLVRSIKRKIDTTAISCRQPCSETNIHHKQYIEWKKEFASFKKAKNVKAKSSCAGHLLFLLFYCPLSFVTFFVVTRVVVPFGRFGYDCCNNTSFVSVELASLCSTL